ncbi:hypothetical protein GWN26_06555, partial [Candidatus Saccharibacteria bacterium]|nr:hypothetical protein [Candidatus Saccharibacteria bacterium]NIV03693.1 hypothetical protein [Calditrichia bacterium]NIV71999.1 hypothetical protein [Calditrichia bacterium]NIV98816.1 hypothetical protein [Candidatus Saccharibacteria bacterium]NIW79603.1 hypothetical protein [Calditrichia bacterium]
EVSAAEKELNEVEEGVVEIAETCPHEDFIKGAFEALKAHLDVAVIKSKTDKKAALDDLCEGVRRVA